MSAQAEGTLPVSKAPSPPARVRVVGLLTALAVFVLDQANKLWLIFGYGIAAHQPIHLTPFFDVVFLKNPGISYSLLTASSALAAGRCLPSRWWRPPALFYGCGGRA